MIRLRESGGVTAIGTVRLRESGGVSTIATIRLRESGGLAPVYYAAGSGTFNVSANPLAPFGGAAYNAPSNVTTETVTVTASEGIAPYTYVWSLIAPDPAWTITVLAPGQAKFSREAVGPGESYAADFKCEVTDAAGRKVDTPAITATVFNYGNISVPYV